jgi:hypothetical protein
MLINTLYPDYDDGLFQRMYIELKEEESYTASIKDELRDLLLITEFHYY